MGEEIPNMGVPHGKRESYGKWGGVWGVGGLDPPRGFRKKKKKGFAKVEKAQKKEGKKNRTRERVVKENG